MIQIKFKEGPQFKKLQFVRHVSELCGIPIIDADKMVKSGTIVCSDYEYNDIIKVIAECGGIRIEEMKPLPDDTTNMQSKKENIAAIRIVSSEYEEGLVTQSEIPVEKHVFQILKDHTSLWQFVTNQMPFICGLIQLQNGEDEYCSLLAAKIPENRNTIEEITSLSKVVRDVHAEMISTTLKFHNLVEKFKPFIDDATFENVETRSDNNN